MSSIWHSLLVRVRFSDSVRPLHDFQRRHPACLLAKIMVKSQQPRLVTAAQGQSSQQYPAESCSLHFIVKLMRIIQAISTWVKTSRLARSLDEDENQESPPASCSFLTRCKCNTVLILTLTRRNTFHCKEF